MATPPQNGQQGGWTNTTKPANGFQDAYNGFMQGRNMNDPAAMKQFTDAWNTAKANGTQINAGTPPATPPTTAPTATGVAPPTGAATSVDPIMGASYMPQQPDANAMAGAAVQPVQKAAPPKPVTATPKKPTTSDPAQGYGVVDPKIQAQAWDMYMRGAGMGGGSYGYNAATSKAFGDQQRQMLALSQNANPATKAMVAALNQRMVDMFNNRRGGARQGGSK